MLFLAAVLAVPAGAAPQADSWFPERPSPRDRAVLVLVVDRSCDQAPIPGRQLHTLVSTAATYAAWREGDLAVAGLRDNAILGLEFESVVFRSTKQSKEAVRRDLRAQRNRVRVDRLVRHIQAAGRGRCRTDILEGLKQVQSALSSRGAGRRHVVVALVTNGVVVARGIDFRKSQPRAAVRVAELMRKNMVARLPNVRLVLVGVGRTWGVGSAKYDWLNEFWRRYAHAAGARPLLLRSVDDLVTRIRGGT